MRRAISILAAIILALTLTLGGLTAKPAAAQAQGYGISACSYANGYCRISFVNYASGWTTVEWYTVIGGSYAYHQDTYWFSANNTATVDYWINWNQRADQVVVTTPGGHCCARVYVIW